MKGAKPRWECRCRCCGDYFPSIRETATWCSPKCRQIASRVQRGIKYRHRGLKQLFLEVYRVRPRPLYNFRRVIAY